jgi:large subunit ribosomal protein L33
VAKNDEERTKRRDQERKAHRYRSPLACEDCKRRNYITMKNKVNDRERIEMKKYCQWERKHTTHKETR